MAAYTSVQRGGIIATHDAGLGVDRNHPALDELGRLVLYLQISHS